MGEPLSIFEKNYAKFIKSKYAIGVSNATDAIELILRIIMLEIIKVMRLSQFHTQLQQL